MQKKSFLHNILAIVVKALIVAVLTWLVFKLMIVTRPDQEFSLLSLALVSSFVAMITDFIFDVVLKKKNYDNSTAMGKFMDTINYA